MIKVHKINLENNSGENIEIGLRISIGSQKNLEKKYCKQPNQVLMETIIMSALTPSIMTDVLTEALNYKGNENSIKSGDELYELLVDNGYSGTVDFMGLIGDIALTSGIISEDVKNMMIEKIKGSQSELAGNKKEKN